MTLTGRGVVTLYDVDHYLPGKFGSPASTTAYDRKIAEWLAAGRQTPVVEKADVFTINELIALYWRFAKGYYKNSAGVRSVMRPLKKLYGSTAVSAFGPKQLRAVREQMIRENEWGRTYINGAMGKIKRMFAWGVEEELVPVAIHEALLRLRGLRVGKTDAVEAPPVLPDSEAAIEATLPYLPAVVRDVVRFQRLTGARPGEVCRPGRSTRCGCTWQRPSGSTAAIR